MRLSYVTVCVNYLDYLRVAHHHNLGQFDDYIIVTTQDDRDTLAWTQAHKEVMPVYTDAFYRNGATFNKGLALNEGLNALQNICKPDLVTIVDADTFVPPDFRKQVLSLGVDREWMYGARRVLLPTWEDYEALWTKNIEEFESPNGLGYGYFQMFSWDSTVIKSRPLGEWHPTGNDCTEVDWKFRNMWGDTDESYTVTRGRLAELPFKVFCLGPHGQNHKGRRSPRFAPPS